MDYTVRGTITNRETGETTHAEHYLYSTGSKMEVLGTITSAEIYELEDLTAPFQVTLTSLALDTIGEVFEADIIFWFQNRTSAEKILSELEPGRVCRLRGTFALSEDTSVTIYHPEYSPAQAKEVRDVRRAIEMNYKRAH